VTRLLVLEFESDSGIGLFADIFEREQIDLTTLRPGVDAVPETADGYDALMILGASPSVNDAAISTWFTPTIALIQQADATGKGVFGICFGAQALAVALGGSVTSGSVAEHGWKMIDTNAPSVIPEGPWFQWHVDAITPPAAAEVLASSSQCVQAYRIGKHLAVQFHPEVGTQQAAEWPEVDPAGQRNSGMSATELVEITAALLPEAAQRAADLWETFTHGNT
jgi:GMP synthase-like glutamine amidotransferase